MSNMPQSDPTNSASIASGVIRSPAAGCVAGIDLGGTNLRVALADLDGNILARSAVSSRDLRDPGVAVELIRDQVRELLAGAAVKHSDLHAAAIGAPGITDADGGVVIATSYLMGWVDVPLRALLESALSVPCAVDNDVNLGALGERSRGAAQDVRDFVFIAIGTGLGAGIILRDELFRGSSWTAGELGYMLVPGTSVEVPNSGEPGPLERLIGGEGIRSQWQALWDAGDVKAPRDLKATEIFDYALEGLPAARSVLQHTSQLLAYAIHNVWLTLNCPLFVLGGRVGLHPALLAATQEQLAQQQRRIQPRLALSALGEDAQMMGALRLALNTAGVVGTRPR